VIQKRIARLLLGILVLPSAAVAQSDTSVSYAAKLVLQTLPWDQNDAHWEPICSRERPCDSIWVDPRVSDISKGSVIVILPGRSPVLDSISAVPARVGGGHPIALKEWRQCSDAFGSAERPRIACVALGVLAPRSHPPDSLIFAVYILSPATANAWSVVSVLADSAGTKAIVRSHGTP
jgi:hypothetical protein